MCGTFVFKWVKAFKDIIFLYLDWRGCGYQSICYPASSGLSVYAPFHFVIKKLILQWSSYPSHCCLCNFCIFILSPGFFCPGYFHVHCLALTSAAAVLLLKLLDRVWCVMSSTFVFSSCSYALLTTVKVLLFDKTSSLRMDTTRSHKEKKQGHYVHISLCMCIFNTLVCK